MITSKTSTRANTRPRVAQSRRNLLRAELFLFTKSSDVDNNCFIVRSPEMHYVRGHCNCDCKILTTAICPGLQSFTMRCTHPSQRCISSRPLAHVAYAPHESGILLTDFADAYPSVNHSWIFHVLEKTELPEFTCQFLRRIYYDSTTHVKFARGQSSGAAA